MGISTPTQGTGLGLSIARGIIRGLGGEIQLVNQAEGGLCVTVILPRRGPCLAGLGSRNNTGCSAEATQGMKNASHESRDR
jgi:hypothetical protein